MTENYRILVADKLSSDGLKLLTREHKFSVETKVGMNPDELLDVISDYHGILVRSATKVTKDVIEKAFKLKFIGRAGVGLDNIDVASAQSAGITVMNTPQGNSIAAAEHAVALLFALARHIPQACASLKSGSWEKTKFMGCELSGKTLGIIGLGNIGAIVAKITKSIGMRVVVSDPMITADTATKYGAELMDLDALLRQSDFITVHVQLSSATKGLLGKAEFAKMKTAVRIINCARGGIVDEFALLAALNEGKVAGAALDVFENEPPLTRDPLISHPNTIVTPHIGASTFEAQEKVSVQIAELTRDFFLKS